jgi:hypothetical protein
MTSRIDAERILDAYLAPDNDRLPDRVIDAALTDIARTPQRRALRVPWRFPKMNSYAKLAVAALVVVVVAIGGFALLRPGGSSGAGAAPTATPSPTPSASAAPSRSAAASPSPIDPTGWVPFTSDRYGYTISYPPNYPGIPPCTVSAPTVVSQAQRDFRFGTDVWGTLPESTPTPLDTFVMGANNCQIAFDGFAETIPAGTSVDDVISESVGTEDPLGVPLPACESEPITLDGQPGRFDVCGDSVSLAVVIVGDRAYVFVQGRGSVAKDLMLAQLSTVQLPTR